MIASFIGLSVVRFLNCFSNLHIKQTIRCMAKCKKQLKELIEKYQKELDFLNERLGTVLHMGKHQEIRIKAEMHLLNQVIEDLNKIN